MALFQSSVLKDHLRLQDEQQVEKAYKKFIAFFHNPEIQENIRVSKEEQFQATFLNELFVKVLDYTMNPQPGYQLTTEFKNQKNARKADGAILKDGLAIGVIELKGTNTKHLEGIRQQAFDYKSNQKGCVYVITSNFEKLRFYINDATEFLEFDLFELNREDFSRLYLCLNKENIFSHKALKMKEASLVEEEVITKQFYKDYSLFKRELFRDLVLRNVDRIKNVRPPGYESDAQIPATETKKQIRLNLFKKSQKLIDRFLFIFFAEDRGLLPPNSIHRIIADWNKLKDLDAETPLYNRFQQYFRYLDTGRKGTDKKAEIFAYNGGLFKPDPILDMIEIDDDLLYKHTARLATYDFESQVDVNILGHIFENSLNEIESVNAEIEGSDFDKQKSKRKKDGVFYTPKYITKYIVENTVGRLCEEKKTELDFHEEEYYRGRKRRQKETLESLIKILDDYRDWLLKLTICDPACGSGAFLNQALDFLIKEHRYIDELKHKLLGGGLVFSDIETTILENNIYGVDINEESVEIAKLSLWLRTAQPRRKLNDLSSNIKCGNSLIDDKKVAGKKAFKWEEEFPDVFDPSSGSGGGFDVVIGNPPYLRKQGLVEHYPEMTDFYEKKYTSSTGNYDIYCLFIEQSYNLISERGIVSFILPHKFLIADFGVGLRKFLKINSAVSEVLHFGSSIVFADASTYTCIIGLTKSSKTDILFKHIKPEEIFDIKSWHKKSYNSLDEQQWFLTSNIVSNVLNKIESQPLKLRDVFSRFVQGIITGKDEAFCIKGELKENFLDFTDKWGNSHQIEIEILKPHLRGEDVKEFRKLENREWLIFPYKVINDKAELLDPEEFINKFPNTYNYLKQYEEILRSREKNKFDHALWYQYSRNQAISVLEQPKIITAEVCYGGSMTFDDRNFYHNSKSHSLLLKENTQYTYKLILPLLNNKIFWFYLQHNGNTLRGGYVGVKRKVLEPFGIPRPTKLKSNQVESFTNQRINSDGRFQDIVNKFQQYILRRYGIYSLNNKLQSWHELEFAEFLKELNKVIKAGNKEKANEGLTPVPALTKKDEFEWMELFEENKKIAQELQREIDKTDKEIDEMVYELYGLTEEEIGIVEGSIK